MKKNILFTHTALKKGTTHVSQINEYLTELFDMEQICGKFIAESGALEYKDYFDNIIFTYDSTSFQQYNFLKLLDDNPKARVYYGICEYLLEPHNAKRKYFRKNGRCIVLANFKRFKRPFKFSEFYMVNWNVITHKGQNLDIRAENKNMVYWGRYRNDRVDMFTKYLNNIPLSTTSRNTKKFEKILSNPQFVDFLATDEQWKEYGYSIYIEDVYTRNNYNHMASRFYEAIDKGIIMFIDRTCKNTVETSNFSKVNNIEYLYVDSYEDVKRKQKEIISNQDIVNKIYEECREIIKEEKNGLKEELRNIIEGE